MEWVRQDLEIWDGFESHDNVIADTAEESYWRARFLSASVRYAMRYRWTIYWYQRWMAIAIILASVILVVTVLAYLTVAPDYGVARISVLIATILAAVAPVSIIAGNSGVPVIPFGVGFILTYSAALLSYDRRAGLPIIGPMQTAVLPFALTVTSSILLVGVLGTGVLQSAVIVVVGRLNRRAAWDRAVTDALRMARYMATDDGNGRPEDAAVRADHLYRLARRVEKLTLPSSVRGAPLNFALSGYLSFAARQLRALALRSLILLPGEREGIALSLRRVSLLLLLGMYGRFAELDESDEALLATSERHRNAYFWVRWSVVTVLPAIVLAFAYILHLPLPEIVLQWGTAFAAIWFVVRVIAALEPNYRAAMGSTIDLMNVARDLISKR